MSDQVERMGKEQYKNEIRIRWVEVLDSAISYRRKVLTGQKSNDQILENYISQITTLWAMIRPKMNKRTEERDLVKKFMAYREYYDNMDKLKNDPDKIRDMELTIGEALELIGITNFEA